MCVSCIYVHFACTLPKRTRALSAGSATRMRISPFPIFVQGYLRSLCPKTLAINLRGGLESERERARRPGPAVAVAAAARIVSLVA